MAVLNNQMVKKMDGQNRLGIPCVICVPFVQSPHCFPTVRHPVSSSHSGLHRLHHWVGLREKSWHKAHLVGIKLMVSQGFQIDFLNKIQR